MERKNYFYIIWIFVLAVIIVGCFLLYINRDTVYAQMNAWKLVPEDQTFTELYFSNYSKLPQSIIAQQPISFSFVIHNVEGATTTYPYIVYFLYPYPSYEQVPLASGTVTLADNASTSIPISYTFATANLQGSIVVELVNLSQSIDFIVPVNQPINQ